MMKSWLSKIIITIVALAIGLGLGLGIGHVQIKKEQKISQDKIKEANRKVAFIERKMTEDRNEAASTASSIEQKCQSEMGKLDTLRKENKALVGQLGKVMEDFLKLEAKSKESDEAAARSKKELQAMERNNKDLDQELKKTRVEKQSVEAELKKTTGERQIVEGKLEKTARTLGQCESNNAALCIIAQELVEKYRNKGLGAVLKEKEPLTQVKKVELEKFTQKYQEEIEQQKLRKK